MRLSKLVNYLERIAKAKAKVTAMLKEKTQIEFETIRIPLFTGRRRSLLLNLESLSLSLGLFCFQLIRIFSLFPAYLGEIEIFLFSKIPVFAIYRP